MITFTTKNTVKAASLFAVAAIIISGVIAAIGHRAGAETINYSNDFESETTDWTGSGTATRVVSGTDGIASAGGNHHTVLSGTPGPNTRFGGYGNAWTGDWKAKADVYLDPSWAVGEGFVYSVASNNASGTYLRDFTLHVGVVNDASTNNVNKLVVAAYTQAATAGDLTEYLRRVSLSKRGEVTAAGWYTIEHRFMNVEGRLMVNVSLSDAAGAVVYSHLVDVREEGAEDPMTNVGGNRYGWFTNINLPNGVAVDNIQRIGTDNAYTVTSETTEPVALNLQDQQTVTVAGATDGVVTTPVQLTISNAATGAQIIIPSGTEITADDETWDGSLLAPTAQAVEAVTVDGRPATVAAAIKVGSDATALHFSQPVHVTLPGQAGKLAGYLDHDGNFSPIDKTCDADVPSLTLTDGVNECYVVNGQDLVIWTNHFSTFVAYSVDAAAGGVTPEGPGAPNTGIAQQDLIVLAVTVLAGIGLIALAGRRAYAVISRRN